jgi:hypothetical protein
MSTNTTTTIYDGPIYSVIDEAHAHRLPAVTRDRVAHARRLLGGGQATLAAIAVRWWGGDVEAAKAAIYGEGR